MWSKPPIHHNGLLDKIFGEYYECPKCGSKLSVITTREEPNPDDIKSKGTWILSYYVCNKCDYTHGDNPNKKIKVGDTVKYRNFTGTVKEIYYSKGYNNSMRTFKMMKIESKDGDIQNIAEGLLFKVIEE